MDVIAREGSMKSCHSMYSIASQSASSAEASRPGSPSQSSPLGSPRQPLVPGVHRPSAEHMMDGAGSAGQVRSSAWRVVPKEYRHGHVPKNVNLQEEFQNGNQGPITTLMIRNIPNRYTQKELMAELEDMELGGTFDFLYVPLDKGTMSNVGYAFVNFREPEWAQKCMLAFQDYHFKRHRKISGKVAAVSVAHLQGLEANLAHYENAAVNTAKLKQRRPVVIPKIAEPGSPGSAGAYAAYMDEDGE